jgi:hypothetical protein
LSWQLFFFHSKHLIPIPSPYQGEGGRTKDGRFHFAIFVEAIIHSLLLAKERGAAKRRGEVVTAEAGHVRFFFTFLQTPLRTSSPSLLLTKEKGAGPKTANSILQYSLK